MAKRKMMLVKVCESTRKSIKALSEDLGISDGDVIDFLMKSYSSASIESAKKKVENI